MKKRFLSAALTVAMAVSMTACSSKPAETAPATEAAAPVETEAAGEETEAKEAAADTGDKELITVGYAQVGAESDWRTANTESFKSTFCRAFTPGNVLYMCLISRTESFSIKALPPLF